MNDMGNITETDNNGNHHHHRSKGMQNGINVEPLRVNGKIREIEVIARYSKYILLHSGGFEELLDRISCSICNVKMQTVKDYTTKFDGEDVTEKDYYDNKLGLLIECPKCKGTMILKIDRKDLMDENY